MFRFCLTMAALLVAVAPNLMAQAGDEAGAKVFQATPVAAGGQPSIDGILTDAAWQDAEWRTDFLQKVPTEGGAPSAPTQVAFLYDTEALYVGARLSSANPHEIPTIVTRRDQFSNAEHILVALDTYHDRRTAYTFSLSSGGVRGDFFHPNDAEGSRELAWNPVWEGRVSHDSTGWYAEMRIPFSQLRFTDRPVQEWGVQINRWMPAADEDVYWVVIPARESGWSSRFGLLQGIQGIRPSSRLEVMPYVAANATYADAAAGNPFDDGSRYGVRAGADFKLGLGTNLTLDATVNPDFGQVEADPAEVNLSGFETFFDERRPFFTEGSDLLRGGGQNFFYSRRIGRAPRGGAEGDFVDQPLNTTILGAAKVTGRLSHGLSVGALTAVTGREHATAFDVASGERTSVEVEPLTGYGVGRLQQEFGANASTVGASFTAVRRDIGVGSPLAALLPRTAIAGGADLNLRTAQNTYEFDAFAGFSHVSGAPEAVALLQRHPAHFLQRPDATEFTYDPTRTSMAGWAAGVSAEKNSGRHWVWEAGANAESPLFDINDAGRLGSANDISSYGDLTWRETQPRGPFRRRSHTLYYTRGWNFGGVMTNQYASLANNFTFHNFMRLFLGTYLEPRATSDDLTRGGPLMGTSYLQGFDVELSGNEGNTVNWSGSVNVQVDEAGGRRVSLRGNVAARPAPRWRVSVTPTFQRERVSRQFLTTRPDGRAATFGTRYVFAFADRTTLSAQMRLEYAFTPDLTLELYAEPFTASGEFHRFGELEAARSRELREYGEDGTTIVPVDDGYEVTADGQTFNLPNPDFNVLSFRSNLVMRWEWLPGSTLFLVWQQDRSGSVPTLGKASVGALFDSFSAPGSNFLAVKATYWLAP